MWNAVLDAAAGSLPHGRVRRARAPGSRAAPRERRVRLRAARRRPAGGRRRGRPGQPVHLVGHDWGGLQGWEFATQPRFEGRLASFTAIAAPSARPGRDRRRGAAAARACAPMAGPAAAIVVHPRAADAGDADAGVAVRRGRGNGGGGCSATSSGFPSATTDPRSDARHATGSRREAVPPQHAAPRAAPRATRRRTSRCSWWCRPATASSRPTTTSWPSGTPPPARSGSSAPATGRRARSPSGSRAGSSSSSTRSRPARLPNRRAWRRGGGVEQLRGRLALVTGAASGIGEATARELAAHGARVLLVDRDADGAAARRRLDRRRARVRVRRLRRGRDGAAGGLGARRARGAADRRQQRRDRDRRRRSWTPASTSGGGSCRST